MGTADDSDSERAQENLVSYFDRSITAVRQYSDRLEHVYARPALNFCVRSFESRPLTSAFVATFAFLSFLPVATFIGCSAVVIASFTLAALSFALFASIVAVFIFATILVSVLVATLLLTVGLNISGIAAFLALRLVLLVRQNGRNGATEWFTESKQRFVAEKKPIVKNEDHSHIDSESESSEYGVVVREQEQDVAIPPDNSHEQEYSSRTEE